MNPVRLPIDPLLPEIVQAVQNNPITLLQAEPGAGKATRVPAALLAAGLHDIYVLEPRRLTARMAASRVAEEMGERLGETVGFQIRFEEVSSRQRKIICATNVAETSITIEGVTAVIDSGLARVLTYSPWSGLSRLQVSKISQIFSCAASRPRRTDERGIGNSPVQRSRF